MPQLQWLLLILFLAYPYAPAHFQYDYVLVLVNDYFQYDYILVHVNDYFQYDYVHVNDYFPKAVRGTSLHQLVIATTLYGCIKQGPSTISMSASRTSATSRSRTYLSKLGRCMSTPPSHIGTVFQLVHHHQFQRNYSRLDSH
jgi:hypothetical protein